MKLPGIFGGSQEEKSEIFVSFVVGKNWLQAGLWRVVGEKSEVLATGSTDSWQDSESFIQAADDSLSSAIGSTQEPPEEVKSVVFGLPSEWVTSGNVRSESLENLRLLCEKLELKPSGFVVTPEALIHYINEKEGAPVSAILVGIEEEELEVMLVKSGKITDEQTVSRSISLPDDITEGLTRFTSLSKEPLPPRIILFNRHKSSLEEATQNLLNWEWPVEFFLHAPRAEYINPEEQILAVSQAAAGELFGAQVEQIPERETQTEPEILHAVQETETAAVEEPELLQSTEEVQLEDVKESESHENKISAAFSPIVHFRPQLPKFSFGSGRRKTFLIIFIVILLLAGFAWWFIPGATVTVYVAPKKVEEKIALTVDPTGKEGTDIVPGRVVTAQVSGEKTTSATGTKTVGERARGEATVLNNTAQEKTFTAGTILASGTGLKFTLDQPATVASESGAPSYIPGQTKVGLTAADIGVEYNLAPGNVFQIANFSTTSFSAKNDNALAGGSARDVPAVSKEDQKRLEGELLSELTERIRTQISGQISETEKVVGESASLDATKKSFSAGPGEEVQTLKLEIKGEGRVIVVSRDKLNSKLLAALSGKAPSGFSLVAENIVVTFGQVEQQKDGLVKMETRIVANFLPSIDRVRLATEIRGASPDRVREKLASVPGFTRTTIKLSGSLPFLSSLPQRAERIEIKMIAEQ